MKKIIFITLLFLSVIACHSQSVNKISTPCKTPFTGTIGSIQAATTGDLIHTPCTTRTSIFNGNVDFSNATVTGLSASGFITGAGTANFIPRFTGATTLANTPFSWNGTLYNWQNTALNNTFLFQFTPSSTGGLFQVGSVLTSQLVLDQSASGQASLFGGTQLNLTSVGDVLLQTGGGAGNDIVVNQGGGGKVDIGDTASITNGLFLRIDDAASRYTFSEKNSIGEVRFADINSFDYQATITPAGTTGNRTINNPYGSVNFAGAASDIVVTNNTVGVNSLIFCTVQTNDATAISCRVTDKAAGSFHIRVPVATGETQVAFSVAN